MYFLCKFQQVGEDKQGYKEIADREKLTELQLRVRQLLDQGVTQRSVMDNDFIAYYLFTFHDQ